MSGTRDTDNREYELLDVLNYWDGITEAVLLRDGKTYYAQVIGDVLEDRPRTYALYRVYGMRSDRSRFLTDFKVAAHISEEDIPEMQRVPVQQVDS